MLKKTTWAFVVFKQTPIFLLTKRDWWYDCCSAIDVINDTQQPKHNLLKWSLFLSNKKHVTRVNWDQTNTQTQFSLLPREYKHMYCMGWSDSEHSSPSSIFLPLTVLGIGYSPSPGETRIIFSKTQQQNSLQEKNVCSYWARLGSTLYIREGLNP